MSRNLEIVLAKNLEEVLNRLNEGNARIIAGGTDVIPGMNQEAERFKNTGLLIDVNHVPQMKGISENRNIISIGAAESFSDLLNSEIVKDRLPLLWKAASTIGSVQIRNRATIAGNFVNNAPCADSIPPLLVYNATIQIQSKDSMREISLNEFLSSSYKTKINKNEVVTKIEVPIPSKDLSGEFYKLGRRRAVAISRITLALLLNIKNEAIEEIRIATGAVTPVGTRLFELEQYAKGKKVDDKLMKELSNKVGEKIIEVTGLRWSSEYKLPVVQQMFYLMLTRIAFG